MKLSLVSILKNFLVEDIDPPAFIPEEVMIFKTLNRIQKTAKTKDNIVEELKKILSNLGFDVSEALYYYYTWVQNYRPDGSYGNVKKSEFKSMKGLKQERTRNMSMKQYAKSKIPFKGSNVEGYWETDPRGNHQYVITSFGWYPIYLFKDGKWYKTSEHYSSSTGRHISNTELGYGGTNITALMPDEINLLRSGGDIVDILSKKDKTNLEHFKQMIGKSFFSKVWFSSYQLIMDNGNEVVGDFRLKWKLSDVKIENDKLVFDVDLLGIDKLSHSGKILERDSQLNFSNTSIKERLQDYLKWFILRKNENYKKLQSNNLKINMKDSRQVS